MTKPALLTIQSSRFFVLRLGRFARLVLARFGEERCNSVAQALSYTTILALVPLTTVAFGLLAVFPVFEEWMGTVQDFIYDHFVPASGDVVQKYLQQFASKAAGLTAVGLLFLFVTALMLMATVEQTFNDIWHASHKRKLLQRFLTYWALLTLGPVLLGISLSLTSYLISLPIFAGQGALSLARGLVLGSLPFLLQFAMFAFLYTSVPNVAVKWRHAVIGGIFASILFEFAKRAFALFVVKYSSYKVIYGAVATLPVFLIWVYVSWIVILLGAIVVSSLPQWKTLGLEESKPRARA